MILTDQSNLDCRSHLMGHFVGTSKVEYYYPQLHVLHGFTREETTVKSPVSLLLTFVL